MRMLILPRVMHFASLICLSLALSSPSSSVARKVAVIGASGTLGRETVQQLSQRGIPTRCLLRHNISNVTPPSNLQDSKSSAQVVAYLSTLPGVEFVQGDINDAESLRILLQGCTECIDVHGPVVPKPFIRALIFPSIFFPDTLPSHPKQLNYEGIRKLIAAIQASDACKRLVRVTGKGEDPWSIFSILINAFSGLAKGWNYEGEQLIRSSDIDYTIVRPGILMSELPKPKGDDNAAPPAFGVADNGQDMKVTPVTHQQIADLMIQTLDHVNCQRATLTVMNLPADDPKSATTYGPLLQQVQADSRVFPESLIAEHRCAARVGGLVIVALGVILLQTVLSLLVGGFWKLWGLL